MYGCIGIIVSVAVLLCSPCDGWANANCYQLGRLEFFPSAKKQKNNPRKLVHWDKESQAPAELIRLLEEPTEENARLYLEWAKQRQERIDRVQRLIKKVSRQAP